jgi:hypothetical protein
MVTTSNAATTQSAAERCEKGAVPQVKAFTIVATCEAPTAASIAAPTPAESVLQARRRRFQ